MTFTVIHRRMQIHALRRASIAAAVCHATSLMVSSASAAAADGDYPRKPIRIIVPSAPSSGPDVVSRLIGAKLTEAWGQQVVADNRAGAAGNIGAEIASRAAPDGYTLLMANSQHSISSVFYDKLPYDLIRDFSPLCLISTATYVLVVNPSVAANSVKELIALARSSPGTLHYGTGGTGGTPHLAAEMLSTMADIKLVHVPYKSIVYALIDVMGGQVQLAFSATAAALPLIKQGKLRALGITSLKRTPIASELETIAETVPGYEMIGWLGLVAPRGTPEKIVARLNAEINKSLKSTEIRDKLVAVDFEPKGSTPLEFAAFMLAQKEKMRKIVEAAGLRAR